MQERPEGGAECRPPAALRLPRDDGCKIGGNWSKLKYQQLKGGEMLRHRLPPLLRVCV
jgi:hypothetical protein